jgi:thiol peroxidase
MAQVTLKGNVINTAGDLPGEGSRAPDFSLVGKDMADVSLMDFTGKTKVLNISPSVDTSVCALSVKKFNQAAASIPDTVIMYISKDLPFAMNRFCGAEGVENVVTLSAFRDDSFGSSYGVQLLDGPLKGLFARAVLVLDESDRIIYEELVPEIAQEPDYEKALAALK